MNTVSKIKVPRMKTVVETAKLTGVAKHRIRTLALSGEIVHLRAGKKILINLDKFIEFLNSANGAVSTEQEKLGDIKKIPVKLSGRSFC